MLAACHGRHRPIHAHASAKVALPAMTNLPQFERLLAEAAAQPFDGWDFSWLTERTTITPLPWDYAQIITEVAPRAESLLDLGTGGGEWLSQLRPRPRRTVATESWPPNVPIAHQRLRPLGISVVQVEPAPDNHAQAAEEHQGHLPFRSGSFQVIANRHESFVAKEVARVLAGGGWFITQQTGPGNADDFHALLDLPLPPRSNHAWTLAMAIEQVESAGLQVGGAAEGEEVLWFHDVGGLAWYLKAIPWEVPSFDAAAHRDRLVHLHARIQQGGPLSVRQPRFWLKAAKSRR
jgi:SAM-dependent methyltransferase